MVYQKIKSVFIKLFIMFPATLLIYYTNGNVGSESFGDIQSAIFTAGLAVAIFLPGKKLFILLLAILMWFVMIGFYLVEVRNFANFFGSTGFGLIFLVILSYIPEFYQKGYIADFQKWL